MNITSQYVLRTLAELVVLNESKQFTVYSQLLLLASTMREDDHSKLKTVLDEFVKEYSLLSKFDYADDKIIIDISENFPKPNDGSYDPEMIRHKLIRRTLLYKLYQTYLMEGGIHASFTLANLASILNSDKEEILRHVQYLEDEYYVKYAYADGGMSTTHITNPGVKLCENRMNLFDEFSALSLTIKENDASEKAPTSNSLNERFNSNYVSEERIKELNQANNSKYDLSKLTQLLKELNSSAKDMNVYAIAMILRSIIDHIPPIFDLNTFSEVVNNYGWSKSNKELMSRLELSLRNIADSYLHTKIKKKEIIPSPTQVDFRPEIDVLISEILSIVK
ncbi:MAG: hypothetical protein KF816_17475 [Melioribacteraceae bacterium]|nr:hypothetical protein [Melioribacteraceae bacterium]